MSNINPLISVILPTYNRAPYLHKSVNSVLCQSYKHFELIIVDDGSTDETSKVINTLSDTRIKYFKHPTNKGGSAARNSGIEIATGEYIAFQDSDDEWHPEKLDKQLDALKNASNEVGLVYTDMWRIFGNKRKYFHSPHIMPKNKLGYYEALNYGVLNIGIQTAMIRKSVFDKVGMFDLKLPRFIDLEFLMRISKFYYFYHIKEALVNFHDVDEGISSNHLALVIARKLILKKHLHDIKKHKYILAMHYIGIGAALCSCRLYKEESVYLMKTFKLLGNIKYNRKHFAEPYVNRGIMLIKKGELINARCCLVRSLKIYPWNAKVLFAILSTCLGNKVSEILINIK